MPSRSWLLALAATAASLMLAPTMAATYSVACDYTAITTAIASAVPGDTIQIAAGTATLTAAQIITLSNSTMGITLAGAGAGQTILQKASGSTDQAIVFIGANSGALGPGLPTVITNITFKNIGVIDGPRGSANSTYRGIHIRGRGGTDESRGQIYNCEFLDFADSGIILGDVAIPPIYWAFHNNLFNGSRVGIYLNENGNNSIYDNTFRNYVVGVAMDANDAVSHAIISGNTFAGGPYIPAPNNYYGVLMSDASLSATASRDFVVRNNIITYSTWGIYIYSTTSGSRFHNLNGVEIYNNSISGNTLLGLAASVPRDLNSQSIANLTGAAHNWWGQNTGPAATALYSPNGTSITYAPWIFSYTSDPAKAGAPGFWPISIVEWDGSTQAPTSSPTGQPTAQPSAAPTGTPTQAPTRAPTTQGQTYSPTQAPTAAPVVAPTPVGNNIVVTFNESVSGQGGAIDFTEVDAPGITVVTQVNPDPSNPYYVPPSNFALGDPATYYDITTNASFSGPTTVCLTYPPNAFPPGTTPRLYHYVASQWVDVTTQVDTTARGVCGQVPSLSPFALGYLVLNRGPLVLKRVTLSDRSRKGNGGQAKDKDAWWVQATLNASTATPSFLADVYSNGVAFELYGSPTGLIDKVAFGADACGWKLRQGSVVCQLRNKTYDLRASFTRAGTAKAKKTLFKVSATFGQRRFNITAPSLKTVAPLEVRINTRTALGIVAANSTKCLASASKLRCAA